MKEFGQFLASRVITGEKKIIHAVQELGAQELLKKYWQVDKLSPVARRYFSRHLSKAISSGEKLSLSETAENLLSGFPVEISGEENIPSAGPLIVVGNHWKEGPTHGMWEHFLISKVVKEKRNQEVRWMVQDVLKIQFGFLRTAVELPTSAYIISLMSKAYDLTVVTAPFKIDNHKLDGRKRTILKLPVSTFRTLKSGGVVGFYPESRASKQLVPAWSGTEILIREMVKLAPSALVLPVGILSHDENLILNFGQTFEISQACQSELAPHDFVMDKISQLLPENLRGHYSNLDPF